MQGEAAGLAGEASGQGEEASPQGLGGNHQLAQTDARRPASQIVGETCTASQAAGEAAGGEMVEAPYSGRGWRVDLGMAAISASSSRVSPSRSVMQAS